MVHKDEDIRREYDRNKKREKRAAAKLSKPAVPAVQITINQPEIHLPSATLSGEDIKDQMIEFLMKENRELKQEIKRLRGNDAEPIYAEVPRIQTATPLAVVETVAVVNYEPRYTVLSEYLNVEILDSWNLKEFMTNMTIEDTDLIPILKASMKKLNDKNQILMKDWCGINDVILSILKRELKKDTHTMPIRRTFFKNKYQHSVMNDRTWQNVEDSVLNDAMIKMCQKICWRLSQLYRTAIKPKSVVDTQYTMMYKTTHQFNVEHMPLWFCLEVDNGATQLYKHVVESIEELITITMN